MSLALSLTKPCLFSLLLDLLCHSKFYAVFLTLLVRTFRNCLLSFILVKCPNHSNCFSCFSHYLIFYSFSSGNLFNLFWDILSSLLVYCCRILSLSPMFYFCKVKGWFCYILPTYGIPLFLYSILSFPKPVEKVRHPLIIVSVPSLIR